MMKLIVKAFVILLFAVFVASGCTSDSSSDDSGGETGSTLVTDTGDDTTGDVIDTGQIGEVAGSGSPQSIQFISATPKNIALKGTGTSGRPETSLVIFQVLDENGGYLSGVTVNFAFSSNVGGLTLTPTTATTDSEGYVGTFVSAGNVSVTVRVIATVTSGTEVLKAPSSSLVVSTGIADQNSFSLSTETHSVEGWTVDGNTTTLAIRAADHFNNPVPDGTMIYFTTEAGAVDPYCLTENGICSVEWYSQDPRAYGDPSAVAPKEPRDGRVTIMASTIGDESFIDVNGNGVYDTDDAVHWDTALFDLPEAHLDIDEDLIHDQDDEEFRDFNSNNRYDLANGKYNGVLCSDEAQVAQLCTKNGVEVRNYITIIMATETADISHTETGTTAIFYIQDKNGNSMPTGSTLTVEPCTGSLIDYQTLTAIPNTTEPIDNTTSTDGTIDRSFQVVFEGGAVCGTLTVTTPLGFETMYAF